jgi:hypothetical protein
MIYVRVTHSMFKSFLVFSMCFAFSLSGCSSSGGSGSNGGGGAQAGGGGGGSGVSSPTRLFYTGSLASVDPSIPTSPASIESGAVKGAAIIPSGTLDLVNFRITDFSSRAVLYGKSDGTIRKVSALLTDPLFPLAQVSNESNANLICQSMSAPDFSNFDNSMYIYSLPGGDGTCFTSDDVWRMVRVGMNSSTSPVNLPSMVKPFSQKGFLYGSGGALVGFLAEDASVKNLVRCDLTLSCTHVIKNYTNSTSVIGHNPFSGKMNLVIDNDVFSYSYDASSDSLSASLYTYVNGARSISSSLNDDQHTYFMDCYTFQTSPNNIPCIGGKILTVPLDGTSTANTIVSDSSNAITAINLTTNKIIYVNQVGGLVVNYAVYSILKGGGGGLLTLVAPTPDNLILVGTAGIRTYTNRDSYVIGTGIVRNAMTINDDQTGLQNRPNATWAGLTNSNTFSFNTSVVDKMILVSNCSDPACFGGDVTSLDAATNSNPIVLGTLPADMGQAHFIGLGNNLLGYGVNKLTPAATTDILFINSTQAGSLARVTTNSPTNEFPLFGYEY